MAGTVDPKRAANTPFSFHCWNPIVSSTTGIVDVSYRYPKMYVVRPQFFIPIITLLRNAALNSLEYKTQLAITPAVKYGTIRQHMRPALL